MRSRRHQPTHVTEQQLDHRHGADVLRTQVCCVQPSAYRKVVVRSGALGRLALHTLSGSRLLAYRRCFNDVRRVAGNVRFQQVPHTAR